MRKREFEIGDSVLVCTDVGWSDVLHSAVIRDRAIEEHDFGTMVTAYLVGVQRRFLWFTWEKRRWLLVDKVFGKSSITKDVQQLEKLWHL